MNRIEVQFYTGPSGYGRISVAETFPPRTRRRPGYYATLSLHVLRTSGEGMAEVSRAMFSQARRELDKLEQRFEDELKRRKAEVGNDQARGS